MSYDVFAEFYYGLTRNVDYKAKADYICDIFKRFNHTPECMLDLACGTGTLTVEFKKRGFDIYGVDASFEMLSQAQSKAAEENIEMLFLCQKMQHLTLYGSIHTCICTLDSINHLPSAEDVVHTFQRIADYLDEDGLLVFDCNTIYKHQHILCDNCYIYDMPGVFCAWQNNYFEKDNEVVITLDFFEPDGKRYRRFTEQFSERAYTDEAMKAMLRQAGLITEAVYEEMSFAPPRPETQREIFVVRKMKT